MKSAVALLCILVCVLIIWGVVNIFSDPPSTSPLPASASTVSVTPIPQFDGNTLLLKDFRFGQISQGTRIIDLELGIVCYSDTNSIFCLNMTPEQLSKVGQ